MNELNVFFLLDVVIFKEINHQEQLKIMLEALLDYFNQYEHLYLILKFVL
jgi:hypothetical protein